MGQIEFKRLTLNEIPVIRPYFEVQKSRICDYSIGGLFMWRDYFYTEYAISDNILFFKVIYDCGITAFTMPLFIRGSSSGGGIQGKTDADIDSDINDNIIIMHALDMLCEYTAANNYSNIFCMTSTEDLSIIENYFSLKGCSVISKSDRKWSDYLYLSESFLEFKGKHMHGQRNHVNKFKALYTDWHMSVINSDIIQDCLTFIDKISTENVKTDPTAIEDIAKTREVLENYDIYGMLGACLYVNNKIIGISIGEIINDTLIIHIEKGDTEYAGVYQMLSSEFAKLFVTPGVKYINREDDSGDYNLRASKLSYKPVRMLEKHTIWIEG